MVIFANILLFIWSSKNCDIIYLKKKLKRIIGPDKLEEEAIRNLIFICMKQQCRLSECVSTGYELSPIGGSCRCTEIPRLTGFLITQT